MKGAAVYQQNVFAPAKKLRVFRGSPKNTRNPKFGFGSGRVGLFDFGFFSGRVPEGGQNFGSGQVSKIRVFWTP